MVDSVSDATQRFQSTVSAGFSVHEIKPQHFRWLGKNQ